MRGMSTSRRTFTKSLLLSTAAFSLCSRATLAAKRTGLVPIFAATLDDGLITVTLDIDNPGEALATLQPVLLPLTLRDGRDQLSLDGVYQSALPRPVLTERERMSRARPRARWHLIAAGNTHLGTVTAPWPEGRTLTDDSKLVVALSMDSRSGRTKLTATVPVTRQEA